MKRILYILLIFICLNSAVFSLDSDYKNVLTKIDIVKVSENNYRVDLHTKNPYLSPVKAIKKGENSYNILLPETNNTISTTASGGDIKSVDVKLYPYAGQDIKNGYTKIVITTSKDINITTNVKSEKASTPKAESDKVAKIDKQLEQIQKGEIPEKKPAVAQNTQVPQQKETKVALVKISKEDVKKQASKNKATTTGAATNAVSQKQTKQVEKAKTQSTKQTNTAKSVQKTQKSQTTRNTQKTEVVSEPKSEKIAQNTQPQPAKTEETTQTEKDVIQIDNLDKNNISLEEIDTSESQPMTEEIETIEEPVPTPYSPFIKFGLITIFIITSIFIIFGLVKLFQRSKKYKYDKIFIDNNADIPDFSATVKEKAEEKEAQNTFGLGENIILCKPDNEVIEEKAPTINQEQFEEIVQNKVEERMEEIKEEGINIEDIGFDDAQIQEELAQNREEYSDLSINKLNELRAKRRQLKEQVNATDVQKYEQENQNNREELKKMEQENQDAKQIEQEKVEVENAEQEQPKAEQDVELQRQEQERLESEKLEQDRQRMEQIQIMEQQKLDQEYQAINNREKEREENERERLDALRLEQEMVDRARKKREQENREQMREQVHQEQIKKHPPMVVPEPISTPAPEINTNDEGIDIVDFQIEDIEDFESETIEVDIPEQVIEETTSFAEEGQTEEAASIDNEQQENTDQAEDEAKILTSVNIEADRGFYIAEFMGKHSLIGFINDNIFVIHTFKDHVKDLNIKYRLVDSSMDKDYYMVKVDSVKFLIKSTKLELKLELAV